jgi:hypothetical protein
MVLVELNCAIILTPAQTCQAFQKMSSVEGRGASVGGTKRRPSPVVFEPQIAQIAQMGRIDKGRQFLQAAIAARTVGAPARCRQCVCKS